MASLRRPSVGSITRSSQISSQVSAEIIPLRQQFCLGEGIGGSNHNKTKPDPGLDYDNEYFMQSIEELLPDQEPSPNKSFTSSQLSSMQRSANTLETGVKLERDSESLDDLYNVSEPRYVYKSADIGRSRTSRSTAQLTTPGSSPEQQVSQRNAVAGAQIMKIESNEKENERNSKFAPNCSLQRSSSEQPDLPKKALSTNSPIIIQSSQRNTFQTPTRGKSRRENSITAEPILSHSNVRPPIPTTAASARTAEHMSIITPVSKKTSVNDGKTYDGKTCCKLLGSQCFTKARFEKGDLEPSERLPPFPRLKSLSACPTVSSFSSEDDIPPSDKMLREVGRVLRESTKMIAAECVSEVSPSSRYGTLPAPAQMHQYTQDNAIGKTSDIYEDFDEENLSQNNPRREIFGKAGKSAADRVRTSAQPTLSRCCSVEEGGRNWAKKLQHIPRRSLRSFSETNDLSRKSGNLDQGHDLSDESDIENEPFTYSMAEDLCGLDNTSRPLDERIMSEQRSAQAHLNIIDIGQSPKRARKQSDHWEASFSDDEDVVDEGFIEINRDTFEMSENRRKKRHKRKSDEPEKDWTLVFAVPKEEPVEEIRTDFVAGSDPTTIGVVCGENEGNDDREVGACNYYMNTYWEHGRASDGRKARDGFISYLDLKEYCRKNNQPTDDRCSLTYKKDLKHHLKCEYHASLRPDLYRVAWNFEHNPGFSFKSNNKDEETRRIQNEAIGNAPNPDSSSRGSSTVADGEAAEIIAELFKVLGSSHTADVAQLVKSKRKVENEVRSLKRCIAKMQKR